MRVATWLLFLAFTCWVTVVMVRAQNLWDADRVTLEGRITRLEARADTIDTVLKGVLITVGANFILQSVGLRMKSRGER